MNDRSPAGDATPRRGSVIYLGARLTPRQYVPTQPLAAYLAELNDQGRATR